MTGILNEAQIEYVLYHLNHHVKTLSAIRERFVFVPDQSASEAVHSGKIIFRLSPQPLDHDQVLKVGEIPVLFPLSDNKTFYEIDAKGNLIFQHDILKSIFYLLSGYQEYANQSSKDALSRFSFTDSICKTRTSYISSMFVSLSSRITYKQSLCLNFDAISTLWFNR